jgi:integrase
LGKEKFGGRAVKKKRSKRTYGTGSLREVGDNVWELCYRPSKAKKRLSKRIRAQGRKAAEDALIAWRKELDRQPKPGEKVLMSDLFKRHLADMRRELCDWYSIRTESNRIRKNLEPVFGSMDASAIRKADITRYIDERLAAGAKPATINRELSALRRSLNLGVEQDLLIDSVVPNIKCLPENNVRKGFVERDVYSRMLQALPRHQQMLWCFGYYLGIRKGELLKLRWDWLLPYWHEEEPIIKVPGFDEQGDRITKSGKPHTIPLYHPELRAFVEMALANRNLNCPYLFQFGGRELKYTHTAWESARVVAGAPKLIFHDTRRTAVRLMEQAGIPRAEAMQITGHLTESVYKRYDIASERGAIKAGRQLRDHWRREAERVVEAQSEKNFRDELAADSPDTAPDAKTRSKAN